MTRTSWSKVLPSDDRWHLVLFDFRENMRKFLGNSTYEFNSSKHKSHLCSEFKHLLASSTTWMEESTAYLADWQSDDIDDNITRYKPKKQDLRLGERSHILIFPSKSNWASSYQDGAYLGEELGYNNNRKMNSDHPLFITALLTAKMEQPKDFRAPFGYCCSKACDIFALFSWHIFMLQTSTFPIALLQLHGDERGGMRLQSPTNWSHRNLRSVHLYLAVRTGEGTSNTQMSIHTTYPIQFLHTTRIEQSLAPTRTAISTVNGRSWGALKCRAVRVYLLTIECQIWT